MYEIAFSMYRLLYLLRNQLRPKLTCSYMLKKLFMSQWCCLSVDRDSFIHSFIKTVNTVDKPQLNT